MHQMVSTFLFFTVISGTMMVVSTQKWFIVWVGLELSTLALVPMLCSNFSPRKMEATMKYFLVQAFSAALLLKSALMKAWFTGSWSVLDPMSGFSSLCLSVALAFKLGLAPCHFWLPDVIQGLPFIQGLIMATWQKMAPLFLLFYFNQLMFSHFMIATSLISMLVGGWGGLNQTQVRKMLAFSSIGNMGWMVMTSIFSLGTAIMMLLLYLVMKTSIFLILDFLKVFTLGHLKNTSQLSPMSMILIMLVMLSLGGLPPLTGFMLKFSSLYILIGNGFLLFSSMMMMGSLLSLFFYLRMAFKTSLMLFPQHLMSLTAWRNKVKAAPLLPKTWVISILSVMSTLAIPLTIPLYMTT